MLKLSNKNENTIVVDCNVTVVYFVLFLIVVMISNVMQRLGERKRTETAKTMNDDHKNHDKTDDEKCLLREFYSAADRCFIKEFAEKCRILSRDRSSLINVKFPPTGQTPFHRVCFHGESSLIELLLAKGADPHLNSNAGESPICFAMYYYMHKNHLRQNEPLDCLEILLKAGCTLTANNIWYDVFLEISVRTNKKALTDWLLVNTGLRSPSWKLPTKIERILSERRICPI